MNINEQENKKDPIAQLQQKPHEFLIVGIGASAGGIQALQEFFRHVPSDSNMAYVVILHLSPDHESHLAHVLQREAKIPVTQVVQRIQIQPNNVYVISPNKHLTMEDGFIAVTDNTSMEERRAPIDIFFRTLADEHGPRAVAIILSGTGANGSMGLKRIKERGGACFVQNPHEAEFNEMPRNAIDTEMVDEVLSVTKIPEKILTFKANLGSVEIKDDIDKRPEEQQQALREIFTHIRVRTGHDFSNYKRPTLLRRIERRINIRNLPDLPAYAKYLAENFDEPIALLKDLLISVTNFFRDRKPFDMIEHEILPMIFNEKTHENQVRIWIAGCATGEEAYSMAMLCAEKTMGIIDAPKVQIFATDIDEAAISVAREGLYSLNDAADVSPERLRRFFNKEGDCYRVRREIREMILFATHNFLKDPPFSHLDMVSCRNVMIYLNGTAQERVIETFHFALKPGGFLFLGTSESVDGASDLYAVYSRENHIFQSRQVQAKSYPIPESSPALYFDKFKKNYSTQENENKILERISFGDLHQQLLEEYASPSLVVNEEYEIVHLTERAGKYLQITGGELTQNLLKLVKPELRLELRSALYQATQRQSAVEARGLKVNVDDTTETVNIHVRPVLRSGDAAKGFILIIFEPTTEGSTQEILLSADEPIAKQLEEELIKVKAQLRAASEQHDFQAEEMKASNEELQAMNEELRSAAEELETSKEELQSINEELRTVNQELKVKIEETSIAGNNLNNLINSTDIGTIFLDRSFRVVLFTPSARNIFNLIPADYGRPLSDITHRLEHNGLLEDAEKVLDKLITLEKEVRTKEGKDYLMRITPYRTDEDRIKGVVITFVDITERKKADEAMRISEEKYRTLFNSIDEGVTTIEVIFDENGQPVDLVYLEHNPALTRQTGLTRDILGKRFRQIIPNLEAFWFDTYGRVVRTGEPERFEYAVAALNSWFEVYASRIGGEGSHKVVAIYNDITERKRREANLAFLAEVSEDLVRMTSIEETINALGGKIGSYFNASHCSFAEINFGSNTVNVSHGWNAPGLPTITGVRRMSDYVSEELKQAAKAGETIIIQDTQNSAWVNAAYTARLGIGAFVAVPLLRQGQLHFTLSIYNTASRNWRTDEIELMQELTARIWTRLEKARAEEALSKSEEKYRTLFETIDEGFAVVEVIANEQGKVIDLIYTEANEAFGRHTGMQDFIGKKVSDLFPALEQHWLDILTTVYQTGRFMQMENYIAELDRWLDVHYSPIGGAGSKLIAVVFNDVTERKRTEANLAFLAEISEDLVRMTNAEETLKILGAKIGAYYSSNRISFVEIYEKEDKALVRDWHRPELSDISGEYPLSQFLGEPYRNKSRAGETIVISDAHQSSLVNGQQLEQVFGIVSLINIPLVRNGQWLFTLGVHDAVPRNWRNDEIELLQELTARIWARLEKVRAEEALRKSEERLQLANNTARTVVWEWNIEENKIETTANFADLYGISSLELDQDGFNLLHPDDKETHIKKGKNATTKPGGYDSRFRIIRPDTKEIIWLQERADSVLDENGKVVKLLGASTDITELKKAEEASLQNEERLKKAIQIETVGIIFFNDAGKVTEVNHAFLEMSGFTQEQINDHSLNLRDMTPPEWVPAMDKAMQEIMTKGIATPYEKELLRADGSRWWGLCAKARITQNENVEYVVDTTKRREAEEALHQSEERYRIALQSANMAAWDWDVTKDKVKWNDQHYYLLGLQPDDTELNAHFFLQFIHEDDVENVTRTLMNAVNETGLYKCEFRIITADDSSVRWMHGYGRAYTKENNRATRMIGVMYDITEKKLLEQQKDDFISVASHELKTPVTSLMAYGDLLEEAMEESNEEKNILIIQKLNTQVNRLNNLITDLLDTTKIAEGQLMLNYEAFNLVELIRQVAEQLQHLSQKHKLVINCTATVTVTADRKRIEQVITNLISNALKYSPDGGDVIIDCKAGKAQVKISISDMGIGIPKDLQDKIFRRFFRVQQMQLNKQPGMGLGLYISAGIIQRHGGSIGVEDNTEKGSVFYFTLPYEPK